MSTCYRHRRKEGKSKQTSEPTIWPCRDPKVLNKHVKTEKFLSPQGEILLEGQLKTVPDALSSESFLQIKKLGILFMRVFHTVFRLKICRKLGFRWMKGYKYLQKLLFYQESWKAQVEAVIGRPELLSYSWMHTNIILCPEVKGTLQKAHCAWHGQVTARLTL